MKEQILTRLKEYRLKFGYSITDLSEKMGFNSPMGYSHLEKGQSKLSIENLEKLAEIYAVDIEELIGMKSWVGGGEAQMIRDLEAKLRESELRAELSGEYMRQLLYQLLEQMAGQQYTLVLADPKAHAETWKAFFGLEVVQKVMKSETVSDRKLLQLWWEQKGKK